jgi:glycosyltransferase involved in cell wall biosynthesis
MRTVIPSKMFESMATGKPVIFVGPRGAGSAVAEDGGGGIVVDGEGPEQLARELSDLAGNGARQRALEANALNASPRFSRERQASETLALLRSLVGGA